MFSVPGAVLSNHSTLVISLLFTQLLPSGEVEAGRQIFPDSFPSFLVQSFAGRKASLANAERSPVDLDGKRHPAMLSKAYVATKPFKSARVTITGVAFKILGGREEPVNVIDRGFEEILAATEEDTNIVCRHGARCQPLRDTLREGVEW